MKFEKLMLTMGGKAQQLVRVAATGITFQFPRC
jgi:hypothetical protein